MGAGQDKAKQKQNQQHHQQPHAAELHFFWGPAGLVAVSREKTRQGKNSNSVKVVVYTRIKTSFCQEYYFGGVFGWGTNNNDRCEKGSSQEQREILVSDR